MNSLTCNPTAAQILARSIIRERVEDAEQRRLARAFRASRRTGSTDPGATGGHAFAGLAYRLRLAH